MLEVKNIHKKFGTNEVLKGVDFKVEKGSVIAVLGNSGSLYRVTVELCKINSIINRIGNMFICCIICITVCLLWQAWDT